MITAVLDYCTSAQLAISVLFAFPLALSVSRHSKRLLWCTASVAVVQSVAAGLWGFHRAAVPNPWMIAVNRGLVIDSLLGLTVLFHIRISKSQKAVVEAAKTEHHRISLIARNEELETELAKKKGLTHGKRKSLTLSIKQYQALVGQLSDLHRTMVVTAMCSGMRVAELLALRWDQLDLENGLIYPQPVPAHRGMAKSEEHEEAASMDPVLMEALAEWRSKSSGPELVFPSHITGRCYHAGPIQQNYFRPAAQKLGLVGVCWHTFPHSYRAWMTQDGAAAVHQKLLRPAHVASTLSSKAPLKIKAKPNGKMAPRAMTAADFHVGVSAGT